MIEGRWHDRWYDTKVSEGRFVRSESQFRNWVMPEGEPGPTGAGGFKAEPGRYHLFAALACPWTHRTLIFRALKGLAHIVSMSVTHWRMGPEGWTFDEGPGVVPDPILGARCVHEIYKAASPCYTGRVTVPILWDKRTATIVSKLCLASSDISAAPASRRRIGGFSSRSCASIQFTSATSSAISDAFQNIPICGPTRESSSGGPGCARRSISNTSNGTIMKATKPSTRRGSYRWGLC